MTATTPLVQQSQIGHCGPACLAMIYGRYGIAIATEQIVCDAGATGRNGASAAKLLEHARSRGFDAYGVRTTIDFLELLPLPCVLHMEVGHWVVLDDIREDSAVVLDPLSGRAHVPLEEVDRLWDGIALIFSGVPDLADKWR